MLLIYEILVFDSGLVVPTIPALAQPPVPVPSCCFMLTNMFDPSKENQPDWESDIRDDVLEACAEFGDIVHIHVDVYSQVRNEDNLPRHCIEQIACVGLFQGHVYVKCKSHEVATSAINSLNGRFFAGAKIVAQVVPEATYHLKFPDSLAASMPLKASS